MVSKSITPVSRQACLHQGMGLSDFGGGKVSMTLVQLCILLKKKMKEK